MCSVVCCVSVVQAMCGLIDQKCASLRVRVWKVPVVTSVSRCANVFVALLVMSKTSRLKAKPTVYLCVDLCDSDGVCV
jgi:hypothetical protein